MTRFGDELKRLRTDKGFSQDALAERSGVSQANISHFENGRRDNPGPEVIRGLADALDVPPGHFARFLSERAASAVAMTFTSGVVVPVRGLAAAGPPIASEDAEERLDVTDLFRGDGVAAYLVRGTSMVGVGVLDGMYVFVQEDPSPRTGEVVLARVGDSLTLKGYGVDAAGNVVLTAIGEDAGLVRKGRAPALVVDPSKTDIRILGVYIGAGRKRPKRSALRVRK